MKEHQARWSWKIRRALKAVRHNVNGILTEGITNAVEAGAKNIAVNYDGFSLSIWNDGQPVDIRQFTAYGDSSKWETNSIGRFGHGFKDEALAWSNSILCSTVINGQLKQYEVYEKKDEALYWSEVLQPRSRISTGTEFFMALKKKAKFEYVQHGLHTEGVQAIVRCVRNHVRLGVINGRFSVTVNQISVMSEILMRDYSAVSIPIGTWQKADGYYTKTTALDSGVMIYANGLYLDTDSIAMHGTLLLDMSFLLKSKQLFKTDKGIQWSSAIWRKEIAPALRAYIKANNLEFESDIDLTKAVEKLLANLAGGLLKGENPPIEPKIGMVQVRKSDQGGHHKSPHPHSTVHVICLSAPDKPFIFYSPGNIVINKSHPCYEILQLKRTATMRGRVIAAIASRCFPVLNEPSRFNTETLNGLYDEWKKADDYLAEILKRDTEITQ